MQKMKYYTVVIDGIDKAGKDLVASYVFRLDKRLNVIARGWPSLWVYNKKFNRNVKYTLPDRYTLFVRLKVDYTDWQIRCDIHNEPKINFEKDNMLFDAAFSILKMHKFETKLYNTSTMTAYEIALSIVNKIKELNGEQL